MTVPLEEDSTAVNYVDPTTETILVSEIGEFQSPAVHFVLKNEKGIFDEMVPPPPWLRKAETLSRL